MSLFPAAVRLLTACTPARARTLVFAAMAALVAAAASGQSASGGATHSLAITPSGEVWAWGANALGQLGTGDQAGRTAPVRVGGLTGNQVAVAAGLAHGVAVNGDGVVHAWGLNGDGQLGDGTHALRLVPTPVSGLPPATSVAAGAAPTRGRGAATPRVSSATARRRDAAVRCA
jgi:hypothetical protein